MSRYGARISPQGSPPPQSVLLRLPPDHLYLQRPASHCCQVQQLHRAEQRLPPPQAPPKAEEAAAAAHGEGEVLWVKWALVTQRLGLVSVLLKSGPPLPVSPPQTSSFSSVTDSTMSLNIITVTLNMGMEGPYERREERVSGASGA